MDSNLSQWLTEFIPDSLQNFGQITVASILNLARLITGNEAAPGIITIIMIIILGILIVSYFFTTSKLKTTIGKACNILQNDGNQIAKVQLIEIDAFFVDFKNQGKSRRRLAVLWEEFRETTVEIEGRSSYLHNTILPRVFFNRESLGMEHGIWKHVPGLFVSVGLLLTFLGLIAALDQTGDVLQGAISSSVNAVDQLELATVDNGDDVSTTKALQDLLKIASAKFIMSLSGLFCSIVFTIFLRWTAGRVDRKLLELCAIIEKGCEFLSEQILLNEVIKSAKEQTDHLKSFSTELVAQVARPLKEDLPKAIRESIEEAIAPAVKNISQGTSQGIENLVGNVAEQLVDGVQNSVESINSSVAEVSKLIEKVTTRLEQSSSAMENATKSISQSIEQSVAKSMNLGEEQIREAGKVVASGIESATDSMKGELIDPMNTLVQTLDEFASIVKNSTEELSDYTKSIEKSSLALDSANESIEKSSDMLTSAATPIQQAIHGIETSSLRMEEQLRTTSETMVSGVKEVTTHMVETVRGLSKAMESSQTTVQTCIKSLGNSISRFANQVENFNDIDEKLGNAFEEIKRSVEENVKLLRDYESDLNKNFTEALTRLQNVVATIEPFNPPAQD